MARVVQIRVEFECRLRRFGRFIARVFRIFVVGPPLRLAGRTRIGRLWNLAPPHARRLYWFTHIIPSAMMWMPLLYLYLRSILFGGSQANGGDFEILVCLLGAMILHKWWFRRRDKEFEQRIEEGSHEFCLSCGYPLHGLPLMHVCPECGTGYDLHAVKLKWQTYFYRKHAIEQG